MSMKKTLLLRCVAILCVVATLMSPVSALAAPAPTDAAMALATPVEILPETDGSAEATDDTAAEDISTEDTSAEDTTAEDATEEDTAAEDTTAEDTTVEDTTVEDTTTEDTTVDVPSEDETTEDLTEDGSSEEAEGRGWMKEGDNWYYYGAGDVLHKGWLELDGELYYFAPETGIAVREWQTIDGETYYFGYSSRKALTGLWSIDGNRYFFNEDTCAMEHDGLHTAKDGSIYFLNDDGIAHYGWKTMENGDKYYFGSARKALTGFWTVGGYKYFFNEDTGIMECSGLHTAKDGSIYFLNDNGIAHYGWKTMENGDKYYFGASRYALTGLWTVGGYKYYFAESGEDMGVMQTGWVTTESGDTYYFDPETGRVTTGWVTIDGHKYYISTTTYKILTGPWQIGSYYYYLNDHEANGVPTGAMISNGFAISADGDLYYLNEDGRAHYGWKTMENGDKYYFGASRYALTGLWTVGGYKYYFAESGKDMGVMQTGWVTTESGDTYYFDPETGRVTTGWVTIDGYKYYISTSTYNILTGPWKIGSYYYYLNDNEANGVPTGAMISNGFAVSADGDLYYLKENGRAQYGWFTDETGDKYYFGSSRYALTGLWTVGGYKYYFAESGEDMGVMQTGWVTTESGDTYYFNPNTGRAVTGWQTIDGSKYYFSYSSYKMLTGLWKIGGTYYYYLSEDPATLGVMQSGGLITAPNGSIYYLDASGRAQYGWQTIDGNRYYFGYSSRAALTGVWTLSGYKYFFEDNGILQVGSGLYKSNAGDTYYPSETGRLKTGWQTIDGNRYYFSTSSGKMLTGLWEIGDDFYYLDETTGIMQHSGWYTTAEGIRCCLNADGTAKTGWLEDVDGKKYYLSSTRGGLATGLWKVGSYYYFFDETTGEMLSDGLVTAQDGTLYCLDEAGHALDGWQTIDGNKYYFGATSRAALTGVWSISGYKYFFEDNGVLQVGSGLYKSNAGDTYYLSETGRLKTGWQTSGTDKFYFSTSSCKMLTGLWKISGYYYYLNDNPEADAPMGAMMKNGWATDAEGNRYYLNANGTAKSEWFTDTDGKTYYFGYTSRKALTGVWSIDGYKYYFDEETGAMNTDTWYTDDTGTYYFQSNGCAKAKWHITEDGTYYFCTKTFRMFTGWQNIKGDFYYFYPDGDNKGTMATNTTIGDYTIGSTGKVPLNTKNGMRLVAQSYSSPTKYLILTDTENCKVGVFTGSKGNWELLYYWDCNCGSEGHETPTGTFSVHEYCSSFGSKYYTCYYGTAFYTIPDGNSYIQWLFHSILYYPNTYISKNGPLGRQVSNGCVRLSLTNSRWIYNNIPIGTTVVNY